MAAPETSSWTPVTSTALREFGAPFAPKYSGTCAVSGSQFHCGKVCKITFADGRTGYAKLCVLRAMRFTADHSDFACGAVDASTIPDGARVTVIDDLGKQVVYTRDGDKMDGKMQRASLKQWTSRTRKAAAHMIETMQEDPYLVRMAARLAAQGGK